ncbi:hypothetical protein I5T78_12665 [Stenotrophomonas maltophilia]|jgi:hypothetical protein|nr:hypothetical protein [Stenotrophomonas maltophilia]
MSKDPTDDKQSAAIEVIERAADAGDRADPDLRALPPIASIRDAAKELGEPDPTTCVQQGSKGEHVITPDNAREIGKACRGILARRNQVRESKQTSQNLRSALSGISRTADSSPKKKMLITNLPEIFE